MKTLGKDWFSDGLIDFEYKKYVLLAYLQEVERNFSNAALYPFLADIVAHYRNLYNFRNQKESLASSFPKEIEKDALAHLKLMYTRLVEDDEVMAEVVKIIDYAIPLLSDKIVEGKGIYDFAESKVSIEPIGVRPIYSDEGYIFTHLPPGRRVNIYRYQITFFESGPDKLRGINLTLLEQRRWELSTTFENMKVDLIRRFKALPNPATFLVTASMKIPFQATFLPIAKRLVLKYAHAA